MALKALNQFQGFENILRRSFLRIAQIKKETLGFVPFDLFGWGDDLLIDMIPDFAHERDHGPVDKGHQVGGCHEGSHFGCAHSF